MKAIGRKAVFIYSGLDVILQITSVDPLEQIYYAGSDSFIPDRTLTPLVLTPRAQVKDKKGISMPSELANVAWYIGTPDEKNRVTSRTQTDDYYLDGLNLVVRKNLEVPQQIYVKAEYLDTRTKTTITIPQVVQLSISKSSEIAPAPTCSIDRPSDWSINPLKDAAIQDLSATIFKDEKAYRGAVKWNKSFNGIKSEIVEEDDFYVSGQLTNSLKINTDKLPSGVLIGCENPSEEFYNKAYGINPEWDGAMDIDTLKSLNYRNLVVNGDFRNVNDAPWIVHNSVSFDKGKITSKNGGYMDISQPYRAIVGHLYYGRIKVNKNYIHLVFSNRSWDSRKNIAVNGGEDYDYFKEISGIGKPVEETTYISLMAYAGPDKERICTVEYCYLINLTEKFGAGNEPTKEVCDELFADYGYIPSPEDLAPDGIVKGNYEADVPMLVKYPDTLDISMKPLPLIPEGVEELELEVEATTSAGTLNNPAKYFDIDYYLSNDEEAGVEPVKVGSGNSVKVTRNQLKERPEYYLEWDYKPRPTTLNKKQSQMDK